MVWPLRTYPSLSATHGSSLEQNPPRTGCVWGSRAQPVLLQGLPTAVALRSELMDPPAITMTPYSLQEQTV